MDFFFKMLDLQLMLFLMMLVGALLRHIKLITDAGRNCLTDLLIYCILPCNIVNSFSSEIGISEDLLKNCLLAVLICAVIQVILTQGSKLVFHKYPKEQKSVLSYGMICSNSSFIGLPIAESLYGSLGLLYASIFQLPIRFTIWTAGLALFTDVDRKGAFKKLFKHPCIIAVFVGFGLMLSPVKLPSLLGETISVISKATLPVSMFVVGSILADARWRTMFSKTVLYFSFLRLIAFPALVWAVLKLFPLEPLLVSISVLMTCLPAGSTTSILAARYGCDERFAAQITFASTLFSIVTIPLMSLLLM